MTAFSAAANRITRRGYGYDTSGNLTTDPSTQANAMVYDSENHMICYTKAGSNTTYTYDGEGHRVKKVDSNGTTIFVYNIQGQLIGEYSDVADRRASGLFVTYL